MGLAAFRMRERRLAELAKAPPPTRQLTTEERLETALSDAHKLRAALRESEAAHERLHAENARLQASLSEAHSELATVKDGLATLRSENATLRTRVDELEGAPKRRRR